MSAIDRPSKSPQRDRSQPGPKTGAFVLLELALALVVLTLGVMSMVALLASGFRANARARSDSRRAVFAENVFHGLRAESVHATETGQWETFWGALVGGSTGLTVAAADVWVNPSPILAGGLRTNLFQRYALHTGTAGSDIEYAVRYRLDVDFHRPDNTWTSRANVTLHVWAGGAGSVEDDEALVFYSEYANEGGL
jgi:hypothetical protein